MRLKYYFCNPISEELVRYLDQNSITYKVSGDGRIVRQFVIFSLYSNRKETAAQLEDLKGMKYTPLIFTEYTEADRQRAKYLWIWPKKQKISIINPTEAFDYTCEYISVVGRRCFGHEIQKDILQIEKEPTEKSKTVFWTEDMGFAQIFVDRKVYDLVSSVELSGIEFMNVRCKNGELSERIYQMSSKQIIPVERIERGHGERVWKCSVCGKEKFDFNSGEYRLHIDLAGMEENDIYMTESVYGGYIPYPLYIISQRFYMLLKENGLTKGADFYPVTLVDDHE